MPSIQYTRLVFKHSFLRVLEVKILNFGLKFPPHLEHYMRFHEKKEFPDLIGGNGNNISKKLFDNVIFNFSKKDASGHVSVHFASLHFQLISALLVSNWGQSDNDSRSIWFEEEERTSQPWPWSQRGLSRPSLTQDPWQWSDESNRAAEPSWRPGEVKVFWMHKATYD